MELQNLQRGPVCARAYDLAKRVLNELKRGDDKNWKLVEKVSSEEIKLKEEFLKFLGGKSAPMIR